MDKDLLNKEIQNRYRGLIRVCQQLLQKEEIKTIREAFNCALDACGERKNNSGELYILNAIAVARIVAEEIGLGITSIISALLYNNIQETNLTKEQLKQKFGIRIIPVLEGLSKISEFDSDKTLHQAENFRKLLLNIASDIRVILIKLAERLHDLRNLDKLDRKQQLQIASETYYLYAPLAHRLGLYNLKTDLEDLSMKYIEKDTYNTISNKIKESTSVRNKFIREFSHPLKQKLQNQGFDVEIKGRTKSIHSIWKKMKKQNIEFEEVYDIFAIRIIIRSKPDREKADCWQVYSLVTDLYQPNPKRLRDWISIPKSNGYESLHTTVVGPGARWVEVQIRTERMNEIAEKGYAAHWKYKEQKWSKSLDHWLSRMSEMLKTQEIVQIDFIDHVKLNLYAEEIFVFTPKGDLKQLPAGSSVLDFAFDIHTDIGFACTGGKVNNKNVPIRHILKNGDQVEIITSRNQKPKIDWLNFVVTSKAKTKIRQALDEEKFKAAEAGKEILKRRFRNWKIQFNDDNIKRLIKFYKQKTAQDLYSLVATGKIDLPVLKELLSQHDDKKEAISVTSGEKTGIQTAISKYDDYLVIENKLKNLDYKLAKCCNPIFGDEIFGFVTINDGIKIHRVNCPNAPQLLSKYGYRVINTRWTHAHGTRSFETIIKVSGINDADIVNRISEVISTDMRVNIKSVSIDTNESIFEGTIKVFVMDTDHLNNLLHKLLHIKGVLKASRYDEPGAG
jgi:guanosine-3',5'-bis(diphosphate) 3'-pyrophosphohydrolase